MSDQSSTWGISPTEEFLQKCAKEYHERCDRFDRSICTGGGDNGRVSPVTAEQRIAISKHAIEVLRELQRRCIERCVSLGKLQEAIVAHSRRKE